MNWGGKCPLDDGLRGQGALHRAGTERHARVCIQLSDPKLKPRLGLQPLVSPQSCVGRSVLTRKILPRPDRRPPIAGRGSPPTISALWRCWMTRTFVTPSHPSSGLSVRQPWPARRDDTVSRRCGCRSTFPEQLLGGRPDRLRLPAVPQGLPGSRYHSPQGCVLGTRSALMRSVKRRCNSNAPKWRDREHHTTTALNAA